jgi:mannosyltransferase
MAWGQSPTAEKPVDTDAAHRRFILAIGAIGSSALWIPPITSSFRTDETATLWVISDGLAEAIKRSLRFQGESPFYYMLQSVSRTVFGSSEPALRILSIVAALGAGLLLYRLGRRLVDHETGLIAGVLLVVSEGIAFAAVDARPYALSIFATVAASLALVRWIDEDRLRDGVTYVLLASAALYLHYLAVLALISHGILVVLRHRRSKTRYVIATAGVVLLLLPALPQLASLFFRRSELEVAFEVSFGDLFTALVPPILIGSALIGVIVARRMDRLSLRSVSASNGAVLFALSWWVVTPAALFLTTKVGGTSLFEPRFFIFSVPAVALIGAMVIRRLEPARARRLVVLAIAVLALAAFASPTHSPQQWRTASANVRSLASPTTPVLVRPGFIESAQLEWLSHPDRLSYLLSPISAYRMAGDIIPLPYYLSSAAERYLGSIVVGKLLSVDRFIVVNDYGDFQAWLRGRLPSFRSRKILGGDRVSIVLFERVSS